MHGVHTHTLNIANGRYNTKQGAYRFLEDLRPYFLIHKTYSSGI